MWTYQELLEASPQEVKAFNDSIDRFQISFADHQSKGLPMTWGDCRFFEEVRQFQATIPPEDASFFDNFMEFIYEIISTKEEKTQTGQKFYTDKIKTFSQVIFDLETAKELLKSNRRNWVLMDVDFRTYICRDNIRIAEVWCEVFEELIKSMTLTTTSRWYQK